MGRGKENTEYVTRCRFQPNRCGEFIGSKIQPIYQHVLPVTGYQFSQSDPYPPADSPPADIPAQNSRSDLLL
jgi:hypothetical protein